MDIQECIRNYRAIREFDEVEIPPAPSSAQVAEADELSLQLVGAVLPPILHELWTSLATIGADGTEMYPPHDIDVPDWVQGVVEANEAFPPPEGMIHVGRRDDDQVSWRPSDGKVFLTEVYGNDPMEESDSLEAFILEIIGAPLSRTVGRIRAMEGG